VHCLADPSEDAAAALDALADAAGATHPPVLQDAKRPERPTGALTAETVCAALGALLPEGAIVSDEGNTAGLFAAGATAGAPRHDWLCLAGGAIGQGLPVAVGAAVACPDRKVVALQADGSAMYTLQSWWTMAREGLNVTTILLNNRSYAVLNMELARVGAGVGGEKAKEMLDLKRPDIDFVALANGMGLDASRAEDAETFTTELERALDTPGPTVIEAIIPSLM
jgi:acetolactate synthase-1/2/3 large subunit